LTNPRSAADVDWGYDRRVILTDWISYAYFLRTFPSNGRGRRLSKNGEYVVIDEMIRSQVGGDDHIITCNW
jgi:hypothetical protein